MTLKEELEILRGEPIDVFTGDPMDIPSIETSDAEKLCKHPVVSVHMITYNHEPYIRQAIKGVMMQKTDFEFELVIGEDASTDKTREICFEYQKKYPDKIRVLWWHENLRQVGHPAGGNSKRNLAHCRGEFIALCEGDDYWIDPLKLQKQVDVMRRHPNVGLCFCGAEIRDVAKDSTIHWNEAGAFSPGVLSGREFQLKHLFGVWWGEGAWTSSTFLMTASTLVRRTAFDEARRRFDIFDWKLCLGDTTLWLGMTAVADAYYLADEVAVYNRTSSGACALLGHRVGLDAAIVRLYYFKLIFGLSYAALPVRFLYFYRAWLWVLESKGRSVAGAIWKIWRCRELRTLLLCPKGIPLVGLMLLCGTGYSAREWVRRYLDYAVDINHPPRWIRAEYSRLRLRLPRSGNGFCNRMFRMLRWKRNRNRRMV